MIDQIEWLGHGTFLLHSTPNAAGECTRIYINPWRIAQAERPADVILVSSERFDRCSLADIRKLCAPHTRIIAPEQAASLIQECDVIRPWQSISLDRACVQAIPACTASGEHTGLGFVVSMQHHDIYYSGDTALTPEIRRVRADIALLSLNEEESLRPEEAAQAAVQVGARWVIPYDWGSGASRATRIDALSLARELKGKADTILQSPTRG
ncbi:MAG: MBL fold metallo-hydrolase [bacterium]|nr:MBL fold metallo-hydrolase [bacterium]